MDQNEANQLFDKAIASEIEAQKFYSAVAEKVGDQAVKEIFLELAREEKGHQEALTKLKHDPHSVLQFKPPPDYQVAESAELPEVTLDMKPADAIALAMKKEQQAMELYTGLAHWSEDASVRAIYENLANMEATHKHRLEKAFIDIGYPEAW